jgi:hypothetical protein
VRVTRRLGYIFGVHEHLDPETFENQTLIGDSQTPQSFTSSQTMIGVSADLSAGCHMPFKRKRSHSSLDYVRNVKPFVAGSNGDNLPHYLTVSLDALP